MTSAVSMAAASTLAIKNKRAWHKIDKNHERTEFTNVDIRIHGVEDVDDYVLADSLVKCNVKDEDGSDLEAYEAQWQADIPDAGEEELDLKLVCDYCEVELTETH